MAKTIRNYKVINKSLIDLNWSNIPKFPKQLIKTWSMEAKAANEIKEAGYNSNNRVLTRAKGRLRNTYFNNSYKELIRIKSK
jgi:hypothetical protein